MSRIPSRLRRPIWLAGASVLVLVAVFLLLSRPDLLVPITLSMLLGFLVYQVVRASVGGDGSRVLRGKPDTETSPPKVPHTTAVRHRQRGTDSGALTPLSMTTWKSRTTPPA